MKRSIVMVTALFAVLAAATGCGDRGGEQTAADVGGAPGQTAPDFNLSRIDGGTLQLSSLRGKAVLIDFWDTWCPPCRRALPHLQELSVQYADDLVVVGVAFGQEGLAKVQSYVKDNGLTFEFVLADQAIVPAFGGIPSIPTTFLVDGEGRIVEKWVGGQDKAVYEAGIRKVIGV